MSAQAAEPLPRVNGRHRDKALAAARKQRAIQLKMQGLSYQQIADEMGYASRGTVYKIIRGAQSARLSDAVEEHRELELARLDALQTAVWDQAMAGDGWRCRRHGRAEGHRVPGAAPRPGPAVRRASRPVRADPDGRAPEG